MRAGADSSLIPSLKEFKKRELPGKTQRKKHYESRCLRVKLIKVFNLYCMWLLISFLTALQLYDRRKKVLKKDREHEKWSQIDHNYMTEESDAECCNATQTPMAI